MTPLPAESVHQGRGQEGSSFGANVFYGDNLVEARLVDDDSQGDDKSVGDQGIEVEADTIMFATAKRVPPFVRFMQDHWIVLSILAMAILGGLASLGALLGTPERGLTPHPTGFPTISTHPSSSFAPSPVSSGTPSTSPTQPCDMSPEEWAASVTTAVGDAVPYSRPALLNPLTPQGRAMAWLTISDSISPPLCPGVDDDRLRQRFGLALLHVAMNGEGWKYTSSEWEWQFMRGNHECDWAMVECDSDTNMVTHILLGTYTPIRDPSIDIQNYPLKGAVIPPNKMLTVNFFRNWTTNNQSLTHFILDIVATTVSENRNVIGTLPVEIFSVFSHLKGKSQMLASPPIDMLYIKSQDIFVPLLSNFPSRTEHGI